jgi:hypothetical protein
MLTHDNFRIVHLIGFWFFGLEYMEVETPMRLMSCVSVSLSVEIRIAQGKLTVTPKLQISEAAFHEILRWTSGARKRLVPVSILHHPSRTLNQQTAPPQFAKLISEKQFSPLP